MCSPSLGELEEVPLDEDDSGSLEARLLAFYSQRHLGRAGPALRSPHLPRTRSLASSEPGVLPARKKSSWRALFGAAEKESEGPSRASPGHCARSLSSLEQHAQLTAVDPAVVSIANRVAEIVNSWPPTELTQKQSGSFKFTGGFLPQVFRTQVLSFQFRSANANKDEEDEAITKIVELLKCSGDQLEKELKRDKALLSYFQDGLSYSVFKTITDQFLRGVDTRGESEIKAQSFRAALAIDAMAKLTTIDNHPMNRVLGFGTKYLKENFTPWVQQHGGWEKVLGVSHEEID